MHCSMAHLASVPPTTLSGLPRYHVCGVTMWQWELWKGLLGVVSVCMGVGQMRLANINRKKEEDRDTIPVAHQTTDDIALTISRRQWHVGSDQTNMSRTIWEHRQWNCNRNNNSNRNFQSHLHRVAICPLKSGSKLMGIWTCWFLRREENRSTRRKTSQSRQDNQQQTQPTYCVESENRSRATSHYCAIPALQVTPNEVSRQRRMTINVT